MRTIALDIRYRVSSGASHAIDSITRELLRQAPSDTRFVAIRYRDQNLPNDLAELEAITPPVLPGPLELVWNELRLPGLLKAKDVSLYHGMKQCAPLRLHCPTVHTVDAIKQGTKDELPLPLMPRLYLAWYVCSAYRRSQHLLPVSKYVSRFLTERLNVPLHRITVVHNGINEKFVNAGPAKDEATAPPDGMKAPFIISVGTVIPLKNQLATVKALAMIADRVPHHLVLLGRKDEEYASKIQEAAEASGIADRLHSIGYLESDELIRYLHAADAMVHVSRTEGFCLATGEAMACGVPLILTDRGALKEQCQDAARYIDDPDDHAALARELQQLLTDASLREDLAAKGLSRASSLRWSGAARQTIGVYDDVLSSVQSRAVRATG